MAQRIPKKEPKMTRLFSHEGKSNEDIELMEFEAELNASADKVFGVIEHARSKMTDSEREQADRQAAAILKSATETAERARRRA